MRGTTQRVATATSTEEFDSVVGNDPETTDLVITKQGNVYRVIIRNRNLQYTCNALANTHVSVKFDGGAVTTYGCTNAQDGSYGFAFLSPEKRFVQKLLAAKKVIIEAEVFQRGNLQQTFEVAGLNPSLRSAR